MFMILFFSLVYFVIFMLITSVRLVNFVAMVTTNYSRSCRRDLTSFFYDLCACYYYAFDLLSSDYEVTNVDITQQNRNGTRTVVGSCQSIQLHAPYKVTFIHGWSLVTT